MLRLMSLFQALILGIVQGITEFLPISSTAHLRLVPALLGWPDPGAAYSAVIQLGTVAAVVLYFAKDLVVIARAVVKGLLEKNPLGTVEARLGWFVVVGTLPVVFFGLLLKKRIETDFRNLYVVALAAIGLALVLLLAEKLAKHQRGLDDLTWTDSLVIGFAQCLALIPGASRSGTTLTAGLFQGLKRDAAARYSFLLSIPATGGAGLLELKHLYQAQQAGAGIGVAETVVGTVSSFVFGLLAIAGLLRFLRTRTTLVFVVYRVLLGIAILLLLSKGVLVAEIPGK